MATAAVLAMGSLVTAQAAPAITEDSWIWHPTEEVNRFSVPNEAVEAAAGAAPQGMNVVGDFGPGKSLARLNTGLGGGTWNVSIGPLDPGLYTYRYEATVAGSNEPISFRNPDSPQQVTSQPSWNTLFIPGASVQWISDVPAGGELQTISYDSTVTESERSAVVWTPPSYDPDRAEPYPVLYLLQDERQSHREWSELGRAAQILDNLAVEGEIEPMVVVMGDGPETDARVEVLDNIVPAARDAFNISADPADQAIAGIGRGGLQALNLLLTDTGEFSHVASLSGRLISSVSPTKAEAINASTDLVRLYVGNTTDPSYNQNVSLLGKLDAAGVDHEFDGVTPETGGSWDTWRKALHDLAPRLFQDVEDDGPSEGHLAVDGLHSLPAPGTTPTPWIDDNGIVTFETGTEFADADEVTIWANWAAAGNWSRIPMEKQGDRWRLTLGPLDGGSYYYKFVVDGVDHKDESNPSSVVSEPTWSTFYVAGDGIRGEYTGDVAPESRGDVDVMSYTSTAGEQERSAYVWTPPDYDPDREQPYPVFYLQHGGGQTWADWIEVGFAAQILDNHYLRGTIVPMVVVMANGNGVNYPNEIRQRLIPTVESEYHVSSDPADRALAGLSMGSGHAMSTLYAHPGEFAYVGAFSAFSPPPADADVEAINAGTTLLRIYSGDVQDFTYDATLGMVAALTERGVNHEFATIIPGPHSWDVWQKSLIDFLPRLFTADTSDGIPIEATIPEREAGVLALTVGDYGDGVALSTPENRADRLRLLGSLPEVTVSDSRTAQQAGLGGWTVSGLADAFTSAGRTVTADHLGWIPNLRTPRPGVTGGATVATAIDDGSGLATPRTLASADAEGRVGSTSVSAALVLDVPVDTEAGTYAGSLYVSLFPVD
ncbi:alpha/beta hydrolase-fold protein [Georgenia sp. MJ173]|uniref:alpha/beta hydrolase-fold protein n=1 Tax=Georgenia sunbinii TaxID=3117728 RepID=UPI002F26AFFA